MWSVLGAGLYCPAVVSTRPARVLLLARRATGELLCREAGNEGWGAERSLGVPVAKSAGSEVAVPVDWQLSACDGDGARVELAARSPDGDLLVARTALQEPVCFECLGSPSIMPASRAIPIGLQSAPTICRLEENRVGVFVLGPDGDLLHAVRVEGEWGAFDSLGAPAEDLASKVSSPPRHEVVAACRCGPGVAVFRRGARGDLLLKWWNGSWSDYASIGSPEIPDPSYPAVSMTAPLTGPPAACSWGAGRLDVFARGPDGDVMHTAWDGDSWSGFASIGMPAAEGHGVPLTGAISVCAARKGVCDIVAGAIDGCLYHTTWSHDAED